MCRKFLLKFLFGLSSSTHTCFVQTSESRKVCEADKAATQGGLHLKATGPRFRRARVIRQSGILERSRGLTSQTSTINSCSHLEGLKSMRLQLMNGDLGSNRLQPSDLSPQSCRTLGRHTLRREPKEKYKLTFSPPESLSKFKRGNIFRGLGTEMQL